MYTYFIHTGNHFPYRRHVSLSSFYGNIFIVRQVQFKYLQIFNLFLSCNWAVWTGIFMQCHLSMKSYSLHAGYLFTLLLSSADFFSKIYFFFQNILSRTLLECQTVWIQIRTDVLSVLVCVQTLHRFISRCRKRPLNKE